MEQSEKTLDMIVNLCKNRGYVFPGSEIYGGLANSWDYGPLGVEFKNNVKKAWLKKFVQESPYNVGLDAAIIMNPQTWVTTGHVSSFSDPLLDCRACKARHRADKLIGEEHPEVNVDAMSFDEMDQFIADHEDIVCPVCGKPLLLKTGTSKTGKVWERFDCSGFPSCKASFWGSNGKPDFDKRAGTK